MAPDETTTTTAAAAPATAPATPATATATAEGLAGASGGKSGDAAASATASAAAAAQPATTDAATADGSAQDGEGADLMLEVRIVLPDQPPVALSVRVSTRVNTRVNVLDRFLILDPDPAHPTPVRDPSLAPIPDLAFTRRPRSQVPKSDSVIDIVRYLLDWPGTNYFSAYELAFQGRTLGATEVVGSIEGLTAGSEIVLVERMYCHMLPRPPPPTLVEGTIASPRPPRIRVANPDRGLAFGTCSAVQRNGGAHAHPAHLEPF